jgi:hypothetical protein
MKSEKSDHVDHAPPGATSEDSAGKPGLLKLPRSGGGIGLEVSPLWTIFKKLEGIFPGGDDDHTDAHGDGYWDGYMDSPHEDSPHMDGHSDTYVDSHLDHDDIYEQPGPGKVIYPPDLADPTARERWLLHILDRRLTEVAKEVSRAFMEMRQRIAVLEKEVARLRSSQGEKG